MQLTTQAVQATARDILGESPDPVVKFRLLRDVLLVRGQEIEGPRTELENSRWVKLVRQEQWTDGSWGRFHSQDCAAKQRIVTTEEGVRRSLALGLTQQHPVLRQAIHYMSDVLQNGKQVCDPAEKNERWPAGIQMFVAGTLAQAAPDHPAITPAWNRWREIVSRTFATGQFDGEAEVQAHHDLHGIRQDIRYLGLRNRFAVALLGARAEALPRKVQEAYLHWLWHQPRGLGYIDAPLWPPPVKTPKGYRLGGQMTSFELLSRFSVWPKLAAEFIDWLWQQRNGDGLWDFGPATSLRFSEASGLRRRAHGHSLCVLALLTSFLSVRE